MSWLAARASLVRMAHLHLAAGSSEPGTSQRPELPIRVVLADDHAVVRRSLRLVLDGDEDVEVVAEASDLSAVVRHVHRQVPRVLIIDLRLPDGSTIDAIEQLRRQVPATEIVVLTMQESPLVAQRAINAGAVGFVMKDRADTELMNAIRCAARGEEYVSERVAGGLDALRRGSGGGARSRPTELRSI